jgi:hypothetical protein
MHVCNDRIRPVTVIAGLFLIFVPLAFNVTFFRLQRTFDYPDILRRSTEEVLRRFHAGGRALRLSWYLFALSAILFTPVPVLVHALFGVSAPPWLVVGTTLGVVAAVMQFVGLIRWAFLVPALAARYVDPQASAATRDAAAVVFEAFHRFAGVAIGEHLGYIFTAAWTLVLCAAIIATGIVSPWFCWLGILPALAILTGVCEEAGIKAAAPVNAIGYVLWSLWLIALGIAVLFWP